MKVCLIHTMYYPHILGGAEFVVQQIAEGLATRGHDVIVVSAGTRDEVRFHNGVKIYELKLANIYWPFKGQPKGKSFLKPFWHLMDSYNFIMGNKVARVLKSERPDVVQVHNLSCLSVSTWVAVKGVGTPLIQVLHDYYNLCVRSTMFVDGKNCGEQCAVCRAIRAINRGLSGLVDVVVGVSNYVCAAHLAKGLFPKAKSMVIYNGYNAPLSNSRHQTGKELRFGFIGRLHPTKGLDNLISSFCSLGSGKAELLIAGEGDATYMAYLRRKAEGHRVRFLGYTSQEMFYNTVDIVVVPSKLQDPLPGVVKEAMAWGKPVIASRRGGIPEMMIEGVTGFLFEPDEPGSLLDAMRRMLAMKYEYNKMSAACLERAKEFAEEKMIDAHEALLLEYARKKGPS